MQTRSACLVGFADAVLRVCCQFVLECRPFYVAGFNAHDLVPKSLANPAEHKTEGVKFIPLLATGSILDCYVTLLSMFM